MGLLMETRREAEGFKGGRRCRRRGSDWCLAVDGRYGNGEGLRERTRGEVVKGVRKRDERMRSYI